jgi:hypothetical protein
MVKELMLTDIDLGSDIPWPLSDNSKKRLAAACRHPRYLPDNSKRRLAASRAARIADGKRRNPRPFGIVIGGRGGDGGLGAGRHHRH